MIAGSSPLDRSLGWRRTARAEFPYEAEVGGQHWVVRINDFPAQALYTLLIDGKEVAEFDDWPGAWKKPG